MDEFLPVYFVHIDVSCVPERLIKFLETRIYFIWMQFLKINSNETIILTVIGLRKKL